MNQTEKINFQLEQFEAFHNCLMKNVPAGYIPWYFVIRKEGKDPEGRVIFQRANPHLTCCAHGVWIAQDYIILGIKKHKIICSVCKRTRGSWKQTWARLNFEEACDYLRQGFNIGIAARADDLLSIIDIDNYSLIGCLPDTLKTISRKRCGVHAFVWNMSCKDKLPNIPTEDDGEVRSQDQYVVCAGSYVPTSNEEVLKELSAGHITKEYADSVMQDDELGFYTVENAVPPILFMYNDLPEFFRNQYEDDKSALIPKINSKPIEYTGKHSALFDLQMQDIISIIPDARVHHPLHNSDTSANFSISSDNPNIAHCWRHAVSLNPLQFLAVRSGYMDCSEAGTGHKTIGKKASRVTGNDGAIFYAWLQAKKDNLIPDDDPIPARAMQYIAVSRKLLQESDKDQVYRPEIYNQVINIVESEF